MLNGNNIEKIRHSLSHLMAMAVLQKFPKANLAIGPTIENGFYYDFDLPKGKSLSENDFLEIEQEMKNLIKANLEFKHFELAKKAALKKVKGPYKKELIVEHGKGKKKLSFYQSSDFVDLCAGPHVKSTKEINPGAFKLTKVAGAYWRGDEKNKMLTRIYGVAFATRQELDNYLKMLEEAEKRDHRIIGKNLDLFVVSDLVGKGLPLFTEKGSTIRRILERFIIDEEIKRGYKHVYTPDLARVELYKTSGHYPYYKESMYPVMKIDEEELILRPMTCPHHFQLYASRPHTYKELPYRIAELAKQFRYEKSGELTGLIRVRAFCLADSHIICQKEQADGEINNALDLIEYVSTALGLTAGKDYKYRLSLGSRTDEKKYYKDDQSWEFAENVLRKVLKKRKANFFEAENEAAFYGPKIDIQMKNFAGKDETVFTVQYDFVMPKRFKLFFIDKDGGKKEPIVIHRSSIGAIERVMAFLIEKHAGAFPLWLSPVQVAIMSVGSAHWEFTKKLAEEFQQHNIRTEINIENETIGNKIRQAEKMKIPYMLVIGDKEINSNKLTVRVRGQKKLWQVEKQIFIEEVKKKIKDKTLYL